MAPDNYQQAWQAQASQTRVTIDADLLRQEVERAQRNFRSVIFWRDFREVVVAVLLIPVWFYLGLKSAQPWTWYLCVPALVWIAGFMLAYRMRHKQKPSQPGEPLLHCVKASLTEVEDQIWLLRNVFWWYLLPPSISMLIYFAHVTWRSAIARNDWWGALGSAAFLIAFVSGLYAFIYYINQRAVASQLEPRRRELLTLLESLGDEATGEGAGEQIALPGLPFAENRLPMVSTSPARASLVIVALAVGQLLLIGLLVVLVNTDPYVFTGEGYPKRSPFAAVRWQESQPEVKVGDEWFQLVSLDGVAAEEIVSFSRQTYGDKWRKRFEEDLVELLTQMAHPPGDQVTLVVRSLTSLETWTLEGVPMTYANRRAIRAAAQERADGPGP